MFLEPHDVECVRSKNSVRKSKSSTYNIIFSKTSLPPKPVRSQPSRSQHKEPVQTRKETTISGIALLVDPDRSFKQKLFWSTVILISTFLSIKSILGQYKRWSTTPVMLSFAEMPLTTTVVPFPAVTICPETKYNNTENFNFTEFYLYVAEHRGKPDYIKKPDNLTDDEFEKMRSLLQVCGNYLSDNINFPDYDPMNPMDHLNDMAVPFSKMFASCIFNQEGRNCSDYFDKIYTGDGLCYTFNSLNASEIYRENTFQYAYFQNDQHLRIRNETLEWDIQNGYRHSMKYETYPKRVFGNGGRSGFMVNLMGDEKHLDYACRGPIQGFRMILHSPSDVPQVDKYFIHVPYNRDVLVLIRPHYVFSSDDIRPYDPMKRHCFYQEERYLSFFKTYSQSNCEVECLTNLTLRKCGCVHFAMPRHTNTKICDANKISCYDEALDEFLLSEFTKIGSNDEQCKCLPGCHSLSYRYEITQGVINMRNWLEKNDENVYREDVDGPMTSRATLHFKDSRFIAWKEQEIFGKVDMLSNSGGLVGMFLGFSVISLIELIYFCTRRLSRNFQETEDD